MVSDHRFHNLESVRSVLSVVVYPVQYLANLVVSGGKAVMDNVADRDMLLEENEALKREHLFLQAHLQKLRALEAENRRLRHLLKSSFKVGDRILIAELLAVDLNPYRQQVTINRGMASGVFQGQPVLDANGVMGQVSHVTPLTATVILLTDANHALPVQVNRNGLRTVAVGTGTINLLDLPQLPNNADIKEGDLLVTSGLGGRFPPGYPVAKVTGVEIDPGSPFARVTATPSAHLDRSREVLLVWTDHPEPAAGAAITAPSAETSP